MVLGCSYNGAPKGQPQCDEVGCLIDEEKYGPHCLRATHAEVNLLMGAAKYGIRTEGSIIVVTHYPCIHCLHAIARAGVQTVYYGDNYYNTVASDTSVALIKIV